MTRRAICLIFMLSTAPFAAHAADDAGTGPLIRVLPASGVTDPDRAARHYDTVQDNLAVDVSKQGRREYESQLRTMIPITGSSIAAPGAITGPASRVSVIPRATAPGANAAPYTQVDRMGGEWGAATVNMPAQQARDYEARIQSELAERDRRANAARHPELRFNIAPNESPNQAPNESPKPSADGTAN